MCFDTGKYQTPMGRSFELLRIMKQLTLIIEYMTGSTDAAEKLFSAYLRSNRKLTKRKKFREMKTEDKMKEFCKILKIYLIAGCKMEVSEYHRLMHHPESPYTERYHPGTLWGDIENGTAVDYFFREITGNLGEKSDQIYTLTLYDFHANKLYFNSYKEVTQFVSDTEYSVVPYTISSEKPFQF